MNKPITILREEFAKKLVELCNTSELPFFIVEGILRDMAAEAHAASIKQYEADLKSFNENTSEEEDD